MEVFKLLNGYNSHALHFVYDRESHLRALIAIDSVVDGRAVGGIRCMDYASEQDAIEDVLRLARGMSFKAALADLPCGGAKAVVYRHPKMNRHAAFVALGKAVENLGGLFHTGSDLGTTRDDLNIVASQTKHVSNLLDFGKHTAAGVIEAIRAAIKHTYKSDDLHGLRVVLQGLGEVGMPLAQLLHERGAVLAVCDTNPERVREACAKFGAEALDPAAALYEPCDILVPCAAGQQISTSVVPSLGCKIIAGSANNLLTEAPVAIELHNAGILYVPDFVASAGALIVGVTEVVEGPSLAAPRLVGRIHDTTRLVIEESVRLGTSTLHAAETLAAERMRRE